MDSDPTTGRQSRLRVKALPWLSALAITLGGLSVDSSRSHAEADEDSPAHTGQTDAPLETWLQDLVRSLERNENLYDDIELDLSSKYRQGSAEIRGTLSVVKQAARFRQREETTSHGVPTESSFGNAGGPSSPPLSSTSMVTVIFDGMTNRTYSERESVETATGRLKDASSHGRVSDQPPSLSNLVRPHMLLLESGCPRVPLSVYVKGTEAVLSYPGSRRSERMSIVVKDLGLEQFNGLRCRKILIDELSSGKRHNGWELWLALERNLIPVRNRAFTYRWSADIPIADSFVSEWKELRDGVWFPMQAQTDRYDSQTVKRDRKQVLSWRKLYLVTQVSLQTEPTAETFTSLSFPSGTKITVMKNGVKTSRTQP